MEQYRFLARRYRSRKIEANGSPMPRFVTDSDRTYFLVEFPIHRDFLEELRKKENGSEKKQGQTPKGSTEKDLESRHGSEKTSQKGSEKKPAGSSNRILALTQKTPSLTIRELSEKLNISARAVEKHITTLKKAGKLKRMGSRKKGWWQVVM